MMIRRARLEDLGAIVSLWREMWDFHTPLDPRFQAAPGADAVMAAWVRTNLESDRSAVFVAVAASGEVQGYVLTMVLENPAVLQAPEYGYVSEIAARPRRRGAGTQLLEAAHAWFRERGLPYAEVNVSVKNDPARRFWRKHGYADFLERLRVNL